MDADFPIVPGKLKKRALDLAEELGACAAGVALPDAPEQTAHLLAEWLERGDHAGLDYMERTASLRRDLRRWWPQARSVLCVALPYDLPPQEPPEGCGRIAGYALGRDYHLRVAGLLSQVAEGLAQTMGKDFPHRIAVDSAPVAERSLAASCGVGVIAKNGHLLVPGWGTAVVLGELALPFALPPDPPLDWNPCKDCDLCRRACPTGALEGPRLQAAKCLSYWTTEQRGPIPPDMAQALSGRLVGCDNCQLVCPHNRKRLAPAGDCVRLEDWTGEESGLSLRSLFEIGGKALGRRVRGTALDRIGPAGLWRNALAASWTTEIFEEIAQLSEQKNSPLVAAQRSLVQATPGGAVQGRSRAPSRKRTNTGPRKEKSRDT